MPRSIEFLKNGIKYLKKKAVLYAINTVYQKNFVFSTISAQNLKLCVRVKWVYCLKKGGTNYESNRRKNLYGGLLQNKLGVC